MGPPGLVVSDPEVLRVLQVSVGVLDCYILGENRDRDDGHDQHEPYYCKQGPAVYPPTPPNIAAGLRYCFGQPLQALLAILFAFVPAPHSSLTLGSMTAYNMSTIKLDSRKMAAVINVTPMMTGKSRY